jgi:hypothetical protein
MLSFENGSLLGKHICFSYFPGKRPLHGGIVVAVAKRRGSSFDALIAGPRIGTVEHVVWRDIDGIHFIESKSGQDRSSLQPLLKTWVSFYILATVVGFAHQRRITTMMMMKI